MKLFRTLIAAFFASLSVGSASALDITRCDRPTLAHHRGESDHRDHGGGIISFARWYSIFHEGLGANGSDLIVASCRSGQVVNASLAHVSLQSDPSSSELLRANELDVSGLVHLRFQELLAAEAVYTLEDVAEELSQISPSVTISQTNEQPCGCAAAYPLAGNYENRFDLGQLR